MNINKANYIEKRIQLLINDINDFKEDSSVESMDYINNILRTLKDLATHTKGLKLSIRDNGN